MGPDLYVGSIGTALLRRPMVGRVWTDWLLRSDRSSDLGERGGDPLGAGCVDTKLVVTAAQVLHESVPGVVPIICCDNASVRNAVSTVLAVDPISDHRPLPEA
jgi:hypothetical protein